MANVYNFLQYEFALNQSAINLATQFFYVIYHKQCLNNDIKPTDNIRHSN